MHYLVSPQSNAHPPLLHIIVINHRYTIALLPTAQQQNWSFFAALESKIFYTLVLSLHMEA